MGPTGFLPGTHTKAYHERFISMDDGARERASVLREHPNHVGVLKTVRHCHPPPPQKVPSMWPHYKRQLSQSVLAPGMDDRATLT